MSLMLSNIILQPRCVLQIFSPKSIVIKPFEPYIIKVIFNIKNENPTKMIQFDLPTLLRIQLLFEMSNVSTNCCNSLESEIKVEGFEFIFIDYK